MSNRSNEFIHIPTAGNHYSPRTGSAISTIIYEITRQHEQTGGKTKVIVGAGTYSGYDVGERVEVEFGSSLAEWQRMADIAGAKVGIGRQFSKMLYSHANAAIPRNFNGFIFVHNSPNALPMLRRDHPDAQVCLWANNKLFRTHSKTEIRSIAESTDTFICCSRFIANDLIARLDSNQVHKVRVVRNGVDTNRFVPACKTTHQEKPVVLFLGRVIPEKGVDLLLKAALKIYRQNQMFKVRIVGSSNFNASDPLTSYEKELRTIAAPMGGDAEFQTFVDRSCVLDEFQEADLFCAPSNWDDPCPLATLEAMACGLAVVASNRGGIPEEGGDAIRYFEPPNIQNLSEILDYFLNDPSTRKEWGAKARRRAEELSWEKQYKLLCRAIGAPDSGSSE